MDTKTPEYKRAQLWCTVSLVFSLAVVFTAIVWTYRVGVASFNPEHAAYHLEEHVTSLQHVLQKMEKAR